MGRIDAGVEDGHSDAGGVVVARIPSDVGVDVLHVPLKRPENSGCLVVTLGGARIGLLHRSFGGIRHANELRYDIAGEGSAFADPSGAGVRKAAYYGNTDLRMGTDNLTTLIGYPGLEVFRQSVKTKDILVGWRL